MGKPRIQEPVCSEFGELIAEQRQSRIYLLGAMATGGMAFGIAWLCLGDLPHFVRHHQSLGITWKLFGGLLVLGILLAIAALLAFSSFRFFVSGMDRFEYFVNGLQVRRFGRVRRSVSYDDIARIRVKVRPVTAFHMHVGESVETLFEQSNGENIRHLWQRSSWKRGLYSAILQSAIGEEPMDAAYVAMMHHMTERGVDSMEGGEPFPYESDAQVLPQRLGFLRGRHKGEQVAYEAIESMTLSGNELRIGCRGEKRKKYVLSLRSPNAVLCAKALQDMTGVVIVDPSEDRIEH